MVALYVLLGMLAAFGLLCAVWVVFGLWLSGSRGWVAVCFCGPEQGAAIRRCRWLRDWGLLRGSILAVHRELSREQMQMLSRNLEHVELCCLEALPARLELELEKFADAGNRNHPGHHRGRGISKL